MLPSNKIGRTIVIKRGVKKELEHSLVEILLFLVGTLQLDVVNRV